MKTNKFFSNIAVLIIIFLILLGVSAYMFSLDKKPSQANQNRQSGSSMQAKNYYPPKNGTIKPPSPAQLSSCDSSTAPWIKITSPNGGQIYMANQQMPVSWKTCNISNKLVSIGLKNADTGSEGFLISGHPDDGAISLVIPPGTAGNYKVVICGSKPVSSGYEVSYTDDCGVSDYSDNTFVIR
jgi:hypothetical protein